MSFVARTASLTLLGGLLASALSGCASALPAESTAQAVVTGADTTSAPTGACDGIKVTVEFGILDGQGSVTCVPVDGDSAPAAAIVKTAGFVTEGTGTYGDQIVCRVNGLPSAEEPITVSGHDPYLETCATMPAAFAYWALWQKSSDTSDWAYALEGLGSLTIKKGESLGLVFTTGDATPTPGS